MNTHNPPKPSDGRTIFTVQGWHGSRKCELHVESKAQIEFARRVISHEVKELSQNLVVLENRVRTTGNDRAQLENSKQRPSFDLIVEPAEASPKRTLKKVALVDGHQTNTPSQTKFSGTFSDWLQARFPAHATMIVTNGARSAMPGLALLSEPKFDVIAVEDDEGKASSTFSKRPDRQRAHPASLAHWLATTDSWERGQVVGFVLGPDTSSTSVELLRFRLHPNQFIAVPKNAPAARELVKWWGGQRIECADLLLFTEPDLHFLDPLSESIEQQNKINWPKISVITVSYNQADYLEDCLRSVLNQDYPNLEYIVIDAVSTDGSQEILERYKDRLSKLVIEKDEGQSDGLTKGLDLATGEILTWINSDDMLAPGGLKRAAMAFMHYDSDLVVGGCERITTSSDEVLRLHHPALPYGKKMPLGFADHFIWSSSWSQGDYFFQPEVMFSADIWRRSGGYLKKHLYWAMDWELWIRMALAGATIVHIPETIGRSREHAQQKTTSEQLYLYQLRNILLEHDDVLAEIEASDVSLPDGIPDTWVPPKIRRKRTDLLARLWDLRHPDRLKAAILNRIPAPMVDRLRSFRAAQRYNFGGYRVLSTLRLAELQRANELLHEIRTSRTSAQQRVAELQRKVECLSQRVRDLSQHAPKQQYQQDGGEAQTLQNDKVRDNVTLFANSTADFIFDTFYGQPATDKQRNTILQMIYAGAPMKDLLRHVALQNVDKQDAPNFARNKRLLADRLELYFRDELAEAIDRFNIVDVGAKKISDEDHIYAPLIANFPTCVVGFDPFDEERKGSKAQEERKPDNQSEIRILPHFISDGKSATFHVNKMRPTSSLLKANLGLAERFSLLAEALTTVETQEVTTLTLDEALAKESLANQPIDFLKIDIKGGTLPALRGAKETLKRTLVCQLETEFSELYGGEHLFAEIDPFMRKMGFTLLDLVEIGRQRYKAIDNIPNHIYHAGRMLWSDVLYVRHLDQPEMLTEKELLRLAVIAHDVYQKYDLASECFRIYKERTGKTLYDDYLNTNS